MNSKEIGQWCVNNKAMLAKIIMKYDRYPDNFQDNFNHLTLRLMERGTKFKEGIGIKFSTYAYKILSREMATYMNWRLSRLSYPYAALTMNKYSKKRVALEKGGVTFGAIPDFIEAKAGAKDLTEMEERIDSEALRAKMKTIVENYLTPTQKSLFQYRYDEYFMPIHSFKECGEMFGYSTTRAAQLERKVIDKVKTYLYLKEDIIKNDKRRSKQSTKERKERINEARTNNVWY